jgi:hypothetical protein
MAIFSKIKLKKQGAPQHQHSNRYNPRSIRKKILLVLIVSVAATSLVIFIAPNEQKTLLSDVIEPFTAVIAAGLSLVIVYRQKTDGLIGSAFAALSIGLVLFMAAEIIWSYYEIGLKIENPFPSIADALWIAGYGPLIYFVSKMFRFYGASRTKVHIAIVLAATLAFVLYLTMDVSQSINFNSQTDIMSFLVSIAYPIFDAVLIVPSSLILLNPAKGELTSIPWIFLAVITMTVGDTIFAYISDNAQAESFTWAANLFFITAYLMITLGLYWHKTFFVNSQKRNN